ncbi:MAG TPA: hypothetical protein VH413_17180 [Verrucomicrobiae bacterium]|nr:hypothetical protein [Verrucomicrobiae bacterium]
MNGPFSRIARRIGALLSFIPFLFTGGCTTFNHDWKQAAGRPTPSDLEGRWQGVWVSDVNHHTDQLRCVITKKADGVYRARFHAKYHKVLSFGYTVPLNVEPGTSPAKFSGEADLGFLAGGVYHYEGHADATNYFSTYSCKYDHGTFQMTRP